MKTNTKHLFFYKFLSLKKYIIFKKYIYRYGDLYTESYSGHSKKFYGHAATGDCESAPVIQWYAKHIKETNYGLRIQISA